MKTYLKLNNEVLNRYSTTGQLELAKDREATPSAFSTQIETFFYKHTFLALLVF